MEEDRFDDLTRRLAESKLSRRQLVKMMVAGMVGGIAAGRNGSTGALAAVPSPASQLRSCFGFCRQTFRNGAALLQCMNDAAKGQGLCYTCGPASPGGARPLCCTRDRTGFCTSYTGITCCPTSIANSHPVCTNGTCELACNPGYADCNGQCINVTSDNNNCGGCGVVCQGSTTCNNGNCICMAYVGYCYGEKSDLLSQSTCVYCELNFVEHNNGNEACCCGAGVGVVDLLISDPGNCGACGATCGPGGSCNGGRCVCANGTECARGQSCCNNACTQLQTDPNNCGSCGRVCAQGQVCVNGACYTDCTSTGTCSSPGCICYSDGQGHGYCGESIPPEGQIPCNSDTPCPQGKICATAGYCITPCGACPIADEVVCASGCSNLQVDNKNCGACGHTCPRGTLCCGGKCVLPESDESNCGGCGITCGPGGTCTNGQCRCGSVTCARGQACCGGSCVDLGSDQCNCGSCGSRCPTVDAEVCTNGVCTYYGVVRDCSSLSNCCGHGLCNFLTGTCQCQGDWIGEDCCTYNGPPIACGNTYCGPNQSCTDGSCVDVPPPCYNDGNYCSGIAICQDGVCPCPSCYGGSDCSYTLG